MINYITRTVNDGDREPPANITRCFGDSQKNSIYDTDFQIQTLISSSVRKQSRQETCGNCQHPHALLCLLIQSFIVDRIWFSQRFSRSLFKPRQAEDSLGGSWSRPWTQSTMSATGTKIWCPACQMSITNEHRHEQLNDSTIWIRARIRGLESPVKHLPLHQQFLWRIRPSRSPGLGVALEGVRETVFF